MNHQETVEAFDRVLAIQRAQAEKLAEHKQEISRLRTLLVAEMKVTEELILEVDYLKQKVMLK